MGKFRIVVALAAALVSVPAAATEVSYDFVACTHSAQRMLESGPGMVAFGSETWGIVATSTTKDWESATTRCVGALRLVDGKPVGKGLCRWVQLTGDTAVGEFEMAADGANRWTWLSGTGKLAGIQGVGSFQFVTRARPAEAGTSQSCRRDWGKYTLP